MADKYECSAETKQKVATFTQADLAFKAAWENFEQAHVTELEQLEKLREERNARLDEARRALRDEASAASIMTVRVVNSGPFRVEKKWHSFYIPEKFVAKLEAKNLYDTALNNGVVAEKVEIAKYDEAKAFLTKNGLVTDFEDCEDGKELTPAVFGPKPIPAFGAEDKTAKPPT